MNDVTWAVPAFPAADIDPDGPSEDVVLSHPVVTPHAIGFVQTPAPAPKRFVTGAVYTADGELVTASQRIGGFSGDQYVAADVPRITPRRRQSSLERFGRGSDRSGSTLLDGLWAYGGHWMDHFGHFITETLTSHPAVRDDESWEGLIVHPSMFRGETGEWRERLAELAGLPTRRHVAEGGDCFPERLVVGRRRLSLNAFARPGATASWDRIRHAIVPEPAPTDLVYFSRARFETELASRQKGAVNNRESLAWDVAALEASFERAGFRVVHPETLSIDEQIRVVANARVIAGSSGSALHLAAFATSGTRVLELGDLRSGVTALPNQRVVCAARGQEMAYIPVSRDGSETQDARLDRILGSLV